jgi:hypothetical protein
MQHKLGYARSQIQVRELEFDVGCEYMLRQLTGSWSVSWTRIIYQNPHEKYKA